MKNHSVYKAKNKAIKKRLILILTIILVLILYLIFNITINTYRTIISSNTINITNDNDSSNYTNSFSIDNNSNTFQPYYTPKLAMYGNPTITPTVPPYITLNPNMTSFINSHEDGVAPNGLDPTTPWYYGTIIRKSIKPSWTRVGLWGQVYLQAGYTTIPENVGIELSNFQQYIYNPSTKQWDLIHNIYFNDENTLFYDDNFENDYSQQFYNNKKIINDGKSVVIRWTEENKNFNFHPYSNEKKDFLYSGYAINNNMPYIISKLDARLVKWDENGEDNLDSAQFIFNVGGDYWDTYNETWSYNWSSNGEIGGGQFRKVTRNWKTAWFTNVPEELCDELIPSSFISY